jgi:hypothetical protein
MSLQPGLAELRPYARQQAAPRPEQQFTETSYRDRFTTSCGHSVCASFVY